MKKIIIFSVFLLFLLVLTLVLDAAETDALCESPNTSDADWGATVSPDGKYIFLTRNITGNGDIYWVSSKIIEDLRPSA